MPRIFIRYCGDVVVTMEMLVFRNFFFYFLEYVLYVDIDNSLRCIKI